MNSTQWRTLTSFCTYLGQEGICIVEETAKGMFLQYIETDPEILHQQRKLEKLSRVEHDEEERQGGCCSRPAHV